MSEQNQPQTESPLVSERGRTIISDSVVSQIGGMAAQEVDGVHMGGSASRAAGGIIGSITGSEGQTRGVSVQVGTTEVAMDLTMGVEYGRNILEVVEDVRRRISERVQSLTGLRVTELNVIISDIVFPEDGGPRRRALGGGTRTQQLTEPETSPSAESRPSASEDTTEESPPSRTSSETASEPVPEDETAELRPEDVSERRGPLADDETQRSERSEER
jgi:uncharacterized alkaline shock family protein YloU